MSAFKRKNGFTWPPDKAQIFLFLILIYFGLIFFGTFTVALNTPWSYIIGIIFGAQYALVLGLVLTVSFVNPAEYSNAEKKITPTSFDREKHKHVIENQFCNICQIVV